jgi:hypothetical protein
MPRFVPPGPFEYNQGRGQAPEALFPRANAGLGLALRLHYVYGLATLSHLGLSYLDAAILLVGTVLAHKALGR